MVDRRMTDMLGRVTRTHIPAEVLDLLTHGRGLAPSADWPEADRLRAEIEAAGWRIVDRGTDFALTPAAAADGRGRGGVRYGSSDAVPSRLAEPADGPRDGDPGGHGLAGRSRAGARRLASTSPEGSGVVVVADGPADDQAAALAAVAARPTSRWCWTTQRLGQGPR